MFSCEHPIRWYHRLACFLHEAPLVNRLHTLMPDSWCTAWERVEFGMACRPCELAYNEA